jgi:hypothetical protein
MAKVRRLDAFIHFEHLLVRDQFEIEDAREKLNGPRTL